jgi:very-short-patch-repair endonuclease
MLKRQIIPYNPKLKELGIRILRFDDREVMDDIDNVLRTIEGFIEEYESI